jgi:antitoxin component of MazEF toxin-antitoxin module
VGGSIVVTLPSELVKTQKIKENEFVELTIKKCRKSGFGALKKLSSFTVEDELKTRD